VDKSQIDHSRTSESQESAFVLLKGMASAIAVDRPARNAPSAAEVCLRIEANAHLRPGLAGASIHVACDQSAWRRVFMAPDKTKLSQDELTALLRDLPDWELEDGQLVRTWTFKDFVAAMAFVNRIAELAEQAAHHPDIDIRYNRVKFALVSHDAGGITARDADMARRMGEIS
jgi:4a-hydroxytetrahydrobiopterin dehydratase